MSKSKRERKPLIDEDGEVRELLLEDIRKFRPAAEVLPPSLLAKLGIETSKTESLEENHLASAEPPNQRRRRSGIPTGHAGEYFVMGELLRQGFDAQLADRNTKGYDLLVGFEDQRALQKVQVKTVRNAPWYVNLKDFSGELLDSITIYVLLGRLGGAGAVRFFIARNRDVATQIHRPPNWKAHGFINLKALKSFENRWDLVKAVVPSPR